MAKKKQQQSMLARIARGGPNQRGRKRAGGRPRGEGMGLISSVSRLFGRR